MTSVPWLALSSRARLTVLLTTPVRLRSRSRPSSPTRGTPDSLVENTREVASQNAAVETRDLPPVSPSGPVVKRLGEDGRDRFGLAGWSQPSAAGLLEHVGSRGIGRRNGQHRAAHGEVLEQLAWYGGLGAGRRVGDKQQRIGRAHALDGRGMVDLTMEFDLRGGCALA